MPEEQKQQNNNESASKNQKDIEANKTVAILSYIGILCFVPLFLKKDSKFAKFHAKQGLVLFIIELIGMFIFWIPIIGWFLWLAIVVLSIMAIIRTLNGEWWKIPYIYDWSKKFNL
jgi:fumarate reductase subunit D